MSLMIHGNKFFKVRARMTRKIMEFPVWTYCLLPWILLMSRKKSQAAWRWYRPARSHAHARTNHGWRRPDLCCPRDPVVHLGVDPRGRMRTRSWDLPALETSSSTRLVGSYGHRDITLPNMANDQGCLSWIQWHTLPPRILRLPNLCKRNLVCLQNPTVIVVPIFRVWTHLNAKKRHEGFKIAAYFHCGANKQRSTLAIITDFLPLSTMIDDYILVSINWFNINHY